MADQTLFVSRVLRHWPCRACWLRLGRWWLGGRVVLSRARRWRGHWRLLETPLEGWVAGCASRACCAARRAALDGRRAVDDGALLCFGVGFQRDPSRGGGSQAPGRVWEVAPGHSVTGWLGSRAYRWSAGYGTRNTRLRGGGAIRSFVTWAVAFTFAAACCCFCASASVARRALKTC